MGLSKIMATAAVAALPVGASADSYGKYETPPYRVEDRIGEVEIRSYGPHLMADVTVRGGQREALNHGFRVLAGYIFGGNQARAEVAMTAPVAQSQQIAMTAPVAQTGEGGLWTVSFMMPSQWTEETLPVPNSDAIRFRQVTGHREAVLTFSGRTPESTLRRQEQILRETLSAAGLETDGEVKFYFYDDPFTLPWQRRNEVALRLK